MGSNWHLAVEVVTLYNCFLPPHTRLPQRYRHPGFYLVRLLLAAVGGIIAVADGIDKPLLAFHIGAATPLIVRAFEQKRPSLPPGS